MTDSTDDLQRNVDLVLRHFDEFVNKQDGTAVERNFAPDYHDHNMPGGAKSVADALNGAKAVFQRFPDLRVEIRDVVAQGDKVAVRAVWSGHEQPGGVLKEFHGFVWWRIEAGKLAERWAITTSMSEVGGETFVW